MFCLTLVGTATQHQGESPPKPLNLIARVRSCHGLTSRQTFENVNGSMILGFVDDTNSLACGADNTHCCAKERMENLQELGSGAKPGFRAGQTLTCTLWPYENRTNGAYTTWQGRDRTSRFGTLLRSDAGSQIAVCHSQETCRGPTAYSQVCTQPHGRQDLGPRQDFYALAMYTAIIRSVLTTARV